MIQLIALTIWRSFALSFVFILVLVPVIAGAQTAPASGASTPPAETEKPKTPVITSLGGGGSSATLLASTFETMGYRAQSMVLEQAKPLVESIAVFLWVCVAVSAILRYVVEQEADGLLWLFVGPILFLFLLRTSTVATGSEWRIGESAALKNPIVEKAHSSEVSWVFHQLNRTISSVLRTVTTALSKDENRSELKQFMTRQRILDDLLSLEVQDSGLRAFAMGTLNTCHQELHDARILALGRRDASQRASVSYQGAVERSEKSKGVAQKSFPENPAAREYVSWLLKSGIDGTELFSKTCGAHFDSIRKNFNAVDREPLRYLSTPVSCEELWCLMAQGVQSEVTKRTEQQQLESGFDQKTWREMLYDVVAKLQNPQPFYDLENKPILGVTPVESDPSQIPIIVGGYMVRKLLQSDFRSGIITRLNDHSGITRLEANFHPALSPEQNQKQGFRGMVHQVASNKKIEFFATLSNLPAIQAIVLYVLALSFPFFCLLVIIPGKAEGFLLWAKLWFWAKSFDVGWVVLALIDDVLWQLMPHSSEWRILDDPNNGPITIFEAAFQGDPSYNTATYYSIMSLLLTAVPILLSQVLLGGASSILSRFVSGMTELGTRLGGLLQGGTANRQLMATDNLRETFYARYATKGMAVDQIPEMAKIRQGAADARALAQQLRSKPADTLPIPFFFGAGANQKMTYEQAALRLERFAQGLDAQLAPMNAQFALYKAAGTTTSFSNDDLRASLSDRAEYWNQPGPNPGGYAQVENLLLSVQQQLVEVGKFTEWRVNLQKYGVQ